MAKRRPRHGQNAPARTMVGPVLVILAFLITALLGIQTFDRTRDHVGIPIVVGTGALIVTWQVWRQKRRARRDAAEGPPAGPAGPAGPAAAEPPPTGETPSL